MPQTSQRVGGLGPSAPGTGAEAGASGASLSPTSSITEAHAPSTTSSDSCRTSPRHKHAPLLTLAPGAIPDPDQQLEEDIPVIWNVISRAADVVKDGERLENLAWRHWGAPRHRRRRSSSATNATESSMEIATPSDRSMSIPRTPSFERRSFNSKLALLVKDTSFKDWVGDAVKNQTTKKRRDPTPLTTSPTAATGGPSSATSSSTTAPPSTTSLGPPDTPVANLEIRLVEPTPAPSRVGSLGGSLNSSAICPIVRPSLVPEDINEVPSEAESSATAGVADASATAPPTRATRRNNNRFFIQSSPGKVSDSSSSQPSSIPRVAPPSEAPEPPQAGSLGSQLRSSGDSSTAIVIKKKERRQVSMANMRGRFAAEKARAAQAIAARNQPPEEESDEWEDEDAEEAEDDDWEDEPSTQEEPPVIPLGRKGSRGVAIPPPAPTPPRTKKERAAEKARLEAERDAQRKREMFAKQAIFGAPRTSEGLLTRTFRSGKSMIDLTQANNDEDSDSSLRRAPTAAQLTTLAGSPIAAPSLLRSKSTVAMPVKSGISVTSHHQGSTASDERPNRGPEGVEMESSDEESEDDDYLQSEEVRAKLEALAAKRAERERSKTLPQPVSVAPPGDLDPNGIVRPLSPTSRRRAIIMREMSESLRKNIIIEREKSSGRPPNMQGPHKRPPPSVHPSRLPTSSSALNLAQYHSAAPGEPLQRHRSNQPHEFLQNQLERHSSHPNLMGMNGDQTSPPPPASVSPEHRRRSNVLGQGFLRPLTRVEGPGINRTHSAAALTGMTMTSPTSDNGPSPNYGTGTSGGSASGRMQRLQAPMMQRSSTEGGKDLERARLRRELAKRGDDTNPGYRFHGW